MKHSFRARNWAWEYFERNGTKYLTNKTHCNAWCKGCLRSQSAALKEEDEQLVISCQIEKSRPESELFKQFMIPKHAICGKIRNLHLHLAECPHVERQVRNRAASDQGTRTGHGKSTESTAGQPTSQMTTVSQEWFETELCRTAASAGWSWNSTSDPEFVSMMKMLRPDLEIPERRVLSGRVLDAEITRAVSDMKDRVGKKLVTGMCDGWKSITRTSVAAFVITVDYQAHIINTHDVSAERKNCR
ncbi:hypothetical protein RhiJN_13028 [Ceratobasidium sp. AG-Ba]|nr:hypothetical protein RhiJN_13028 [Ceratobasidium sp. AG-Ba]